MGRKKAKKNEEKIFWQVHRIDRSCQFVNLCATAEEATEEVRRALKAGFQVQVTTLLHTQEYYDSLDDFSNTGWQPL